jgi:hypothetical protein
MSTENAKCISISVDGDEIKALRKATELLSGIGWHAEASQITCVLARLGVNTQMLTVEDIREIAEKIPCSAGKGFASWGTGYRKDESGKYTVPQLPGVFEQFAHALIEALETKRRSD